ncbi:hypothetical protein GF325_16495 [Candidatus Bathyarchaeota archaeon]|nr:hypothetical protein [Candidatus Bathyarchaeota archaeon]
MDAGYTWGITFGLIGSCTLNLGKAIQKQGIEVFGKIEDGETRRAKKGAIWILGSILSLIQPVFQTIGLSILGGNPEIYSSMLGVGVVIALLYSVKVLKEELKKHEIIGTGLIIGGTLAFGIASIFQDRPDTRILDWTNFVTTMIVLLVIFLLCIIYTLKTGQIWGIIWGAIAGAFGGMDNVFKSIADEENFGLPGPLSAFSSVFLYVSFAFGGLAFLLTNVGYTKGKAVRVVPSYTAFYIFMPMLLGVLFFMVIPTAFQVIGITIAVSGVVMTTAFKVKAQATTTGDETRDHERD